MCGDIMATPTEPSKIKYLQYWCYKILPLVYDDSLSYYEVLSKTTDKVNELVDACQKYYQDAIKYADDLNAETFKDVKEYIDEQLDVEGILDKVNKALDDAITKVDTNLEEFRKENEELQLYIETIEKNLDTKIVEQNANVAATVAELTKDVTAQLEALRVYSDTQDTVLRDYIDTELQKIMDSLPEITSVQVIDPTTGQIADIGEVLQNMYSALTYWAFTAAEFDKAGYTCDYLDGLKLTALEWDTRGMNLSKPDETKTVRNPRTGEMDTVQHVLDWLASFHMLGNTAEEFDELGDEFICTYVDGLDYQGYVIDDSGYKAA